MALDTTKGQGFVSTQPLEHLVEVRREISNAEIYEMLVWSKDPQWPGNFRHRFDNQRQVFMVSFSDENVAFQFKIRWG